MRSSIQRLSLALVLVGALAAGCAAPKEPHAAVRGPRTVEGSLEDFAVEAPRVLAMTDEEPATGTGDPLVDHLMTALGVDEPVARCIVDAASGSFAPNEFAVLSFAAMYTDDRRALAADILGCTPPAPLAAMLITDDADLRDCIGTRADPDSAALVVAAVAAAAITDLRQSWSGRLPAASECLQPEPAPAVTPDPDATPDEAAAPVPPAVRLAAALRAPDDWEFAVIDPESHGAAAVADAIDGGHAAAAFEVRRAQTTTPDAVVWVIAWDPTLATDRAFGESWLAWIRSEQDTSQIDVAGVPVEVLVDPGSGIEQHLVTLDGLALVISDTGGGDTALGVVIEAALGGA